MITTIIKTPAGIRRKAFLDKTYNLLLVSCVACASLHAKVTMELPSKHNVGDWEVVDIQHGNAKQKTKPATKKQKRTALV